MLPRHTNQLLTALERVADVGCVELRKEQILRWYSQERMTIGIWRDLQERWEEVLEQTEETVDIPLLIGEGLGLYVFVWGEGMKSEPDSWLKECSDLAKRKTGVETDPD